MRDPGFALELIEKKHVRNSELGALIVIAMCELTNKAVAKSNDLFALNGFRPLTAYFPGQAPA